MERKLSLVATLWSYCLGFLGGSLKYKYDASDSKWMNVDSIISIVAMTYQPFSKLYALDSNGDEYLVEFVSTKG